MDEITYDKDARAEFKSRLKPECRLNEPVNDDEVALFSLKFDWSSGVTGELLHKAYEETISQAKE